MNKKRREIFGALRGKIILSEDFDKSIDYLFDVYNDMNNTILTESEQIFLDNIEDILA